MIYANLRSTAHPRCGHFQICFAALSPVTPVSEQLPCGNSDFRTLPLRLYFTLAGQSRLFCSEQLNSILIAINLSARVNVLKRMSVSLPLCDLDLVPHLTDEEFVDVPVVAATLGRSRNRR